jgi:hypothetical protein
VHETRELKAGLLSLSDPALRTQWLLHKLTHWPSFMAAGALSELVEQSESAHADAKEAMHSVVSAIVRDPLSALWDSLRHEAKLRDLFSLQRLLRRDEPTSATAVVEEEPQIPDYGAGRDLTLGERRSLARRPERKWIERLLRDPHPMVIDLLLQNPKLTESDVLRLVTSRSARPVVLSSMVRYERWLNSGAVRHALALNPRTPLLISVPLLFLSTRPQLREIRATGNLPVAVRATAAELLQRRPPREIAHGDSSAVH